MRFEINKKPSIAVFKYGLFCPIRTGRTGLSKYFATSAQYHGCCYHSYYDMLLALSTGSVIENWALHCSYLILFSFAIGKSPIAIHSVNHLCAVPHRKSDQQHLPSSRPDGQPTYPGLWRSLSIPKTRNDGRGRGRGRGT